jgi:hypothetical protein
VTTVKSAAVKSVPGEGVFERAPRRGPACAGNFSVVIFARLVTFIAILLLPVSWAWAQSEVPPTGGETVKGETVKLEGVYLILWGYQGEEKSYTAKERPKLQPLVDALVAKNYTVYEDGPSFDQSKIDKAFEAAERSAHPKQILIDWNTTRANLDKYLGIRTLKGIVWMSHGFMEPWPAETGDDLKKFESRVWTAKAGKPDETESRVFVREWEKALNGNPKLHFIVMHACGTGGLGGDEGYRTDPWKHTADATKKKAEARFGTPPPPYDQLTLTTFDALAPLTEWIKTYNGASYFDLNDLNIDDLTSRAKD